MTNNIILNADSYKASHFLQYPPNTTHVSSYIESRGGKYEKALFFGLQFFLKEYLTKPITLADVNEANEFYSLHGVPFHKEGWENIVNKHGGYLPLEIEAVAEGAVNTVKNVMAQVVNTDPECFWLTSYIETAILRAIWYPTTVATLSYYCKQTIKEFLERTADNIDGLPFKLHDFGARGASSMETASLGGAAHLVNFMGSDTLSGILAANRYYNEKMAAFSIPAAEHSTITSWGKENESKAYENMLDQFSGEGKLVAVVSDSYDLWNAIDNIWGDELKQKVIDNGGTVVIRPDSGEPIDIVLKTLQKLMLKFGYRTNSKGFKVLPDYIRVIQGDGVSPDMIRSILFNLELNGISADNLAFGMGGELLQKTDRDTLKFAMKASAVKKDGVWNDVYKDPITDIGKRSKKGRLALVRNTEGSDVESVRLDDLNGRDNLLSPVFRNGEILKDYTLSDVRERSNSQ